MLEISPLSAQPDAATLGERIYAELRDQLIAGELAPGEKLSLRTIAERLGASMTPVREAVSRLAAAGALVVSPNRAVSVPVMRREDFRELTTVRMAIEGFGAEQAAVARSDRDMEAIRRADAAFRRETRSPVPDLSAAVRANRDLHFATYAATRLPTLVGVIAGLWLRIGPVLNLDMKASPERLASGGAEARHARLLDAIQRGDGPAARRALVEDIESAAGFIEATGRLPD